jgi:hypothetical protein
MTSIRQIEANRRNATRSTGPTTEAGKHRSRRNAVRHGLSAETVVEIIEDVDDYRGFEAAIIADYDARTAVERELVLRLASLLWRLRRATAIETDLLRIQAEVLRDRRNHHLPDRSPNMPSPILGLTPHRITDAEGAEYASGPWQTDRDACFDASSWAPQPISSARGLAHSFLRLANLDNGVFERLGRYESALARQVMRILFLIRAAKVR